MTSGQVIDFKEALKYSLSSILLSLGFLDGSIGAYIIDLMAAIWAAGIFLTVEELLINQVLPIILRDCGRVDLVANSYREISWEKSTNAPRGEGPFTILKSAKVKIQDTNAFQHENENKSPLIKLSFNWLIDSKRKTLNTLRTTSLYLSTEEYYQRLPIWDVSSIDKLISKHEDADFRLMVHAKHAINSNSPVIIKYVGLSALVPCQATLKLHILHANKVAYLMKRSSVAQVEELPVADCS